MHGLHLVPHAHCALVEGQLVFLDLRADRYSCVSASMGDEAIGALTEAELLTRDPGRGRPFAPTPHLSPTTDLSGYPVGRAPEIGPGHVARFLAAAALTAARLRWSSLSRIVARLRDRKRRNPSHLGGSFSRSGRPRELVEIYKRLRPLVYTTRDQCLFDSLALVEFVAAHGLLPTLVMGVRMGPFAAHAWVQDDGVVLNDTVANVARFSTIMTV